MNKKYKILGYCKDCTFIDEMGCNQGEPFDLGESDSIENATEIAFNHSKECHTYFSIVIDKTNMKVVLEIY